MSVAWIRFFNAVRWWTRCSRKRARSRSARTVGSGSQISGTRSRRASSANTRASIRSVLAASGAMPLTLAASAMATSQPERSSVSWTKRAPVIDSIAACTASPRRRTWAPSARSPAASGLTAVTDTVRPSSSSTCTSSLRRDRSNPTYNITGASAMVLRQPSGCHARPLFMTFHRVAVPPERRARAIRPLGAGQPRVGDVDHLPLVQLTTKVVEWTKHAV